MKNKRVFIVGLAALLVILFALICLFILHKGKYVGDDAYEEILSLTRQQMYPEALEKILISYDLTFQQNYFRNLGPRMSFDISAWKALGEKYPPALEAMNRVRDEKVAMLRSGDFSDVNFDQEVLRAENPSNSQEKHDAILAKVIMRDVNALNRALDEQNNTIEIFAYLQQHTPKLAAACFSEVKRSVLQQKRYDLAAHYITDYYAEQNDLLARYNRSLERNVSREYAVDSLIESTTDLANMAIAAKKFDDAVGILRMAKKASDTSRLDSLIDEVENKITSDKLRTPRSNQHR